MSIPYNNLTAKEAIEKLRKGNEAFLNSEHSMGNVSPRIRKDTYLHGQHPYAIIITCSDSRVIPESIFSADIGDLFIIRVAGNVIDDHQLGSIEYAEEHLGVNLVLVLGHTFCGAVDAAINHDPDGYIKFITDEIKKAIGEESDDYKACALNVQHSIDQIESSLEIQKDEREHGLKVYGAIYHLEDGRVDFLIPEASDTK